MAIWSTHHKNCIKVFTMIQKANPASPCEDQLEMVYHYGKQNDKMTYHTQISQEPEHLGRANKLIYNVLTNPTILCITTCFQPLLSF